MRLNSRLRPSSLPTGTFTEQNTSVTITPSLAGRATILAVLISCLSPSASESLAPSRGIDGPGVGPDDGITVAAGASARAAVGGRTSDWTAVETAAAEGPLLQFRFQSMSNRCDGRNHLDDDHVDNCMMGGPIVAFDWTPKDTVNITGLDIFTGETAGNNILNDLGVYSDDGNLPSRPSQLLGRTAKFEVLAEKGWFGGDLPSPVVAEAGTKYWIGWDPTGANEQCSASDDPAGEQQKYWGCRSPDLADCASSDWFGPFSFSDRRWKFRVRCWKDADGDGVKDEDDLCPDTYIPEAAVPSRRLRKNRWALVNNDTSFATMIRRGGTISLVAVENGFTVGDTRGCSCEQITDILNLRKGQRKRGCLTEAMQQWVDMAAQL